MERNGDRGIRSALKRKLQNLEDGENTETIMPFAKNMTLYQRTYGSRKRCFQLRQRRNPNLSLLLHVCPI